MGLKEEILALDDLRTEVVVVPEWGGRQIRLQEMTGADRDAYEGGLVEKRAKGLSQYVNARAELVARCAVDDRGERIFSEAEIAALGKKNSKALDRLFDVCIKLNQITEAEVKEIEKP